MRLLPRWVLTGNSHAIYDAESATAIQQTAKVYGAMQELIEEYNGFVDKLNAEIASFEKEQQEKTECFKTCITELVENYIKSIDLKIDSQDKVIAEAVDYMKTNLNKTTEEYINSIITNGRLQLEEVYNEETESLEIRLAKFVIE